MTNKERFVIKCIDYWKVLLKMDDWQVKVYFEKGDDEKIDADRIVGATMSSHTNGKWCTLRIFPCLFDYGDEYIWETICHELCHAIVKEFSDAISAQWNGKLISPDHEYSINERTTKWIEEIVLLDRDFKNFKKINL